MSMPLMWNAKAGGLAHARRAGVAPSLLMLALAACGANGGDRAAGTAEPSAATQPSQAQPSPSESAAPPRVGSTQGDIALPGAGAVAFDGANARIAWSSGSDVRIRELASGAVTPLAAGASVADLGYAPDGALWTVGGDVVRWQGGKPACSAQVDADRLLGVDAQGVVVAGYGHSDGAGMLRHQAWLDNACRVTHERTDPLPANISDAETDPGAPLQRDSLHAPRMPAETAPALPAGTRAIASTPDGRYWVIEVAGERRLRDARAQ